MTAGLTQPLPRPHASATLSTCLGMYHPQTAQQGPQEGRKAWPKGTYTPGLADTYTSNKPHLWAHVQKHVDTH